MKNNIFADITEYKTINKEIEEINSIISSNLMNLKKSKIGQYEDGYSSPFKAEDKFGWNVESEKVNSKYEKELSKLEDRKEELAKEILEQSSRHMLSFIGSPNKNTLNLTYCFPVNKDKIIKISFNTTLKKYSAADKNNAATKGTIESNVNSGRGLVNLFGLVDGEDPKKKVFYCETSKESSLTEFLKKTSKLYLENFNEHLKTFGLSDFETDDIIRDTKNQFAWLHSKIYDALLHLDVSSAESILKPLTFDKEIVGELITYGVEKEKERLFYVLANNLVSDSTKSKLPKI